MNQTIQPHSGSWVTFTYASFAASGPLATAEKLAEQGFGPRMKSTADDVLSRLKARQKPAA